ncbi:MAG: FkbM family methyltransferase [Thalassobaculum sp.]
MTTSDSRTPDLWTTAVVDAGGRYGVHPTWRGYEAPLDYVMFEPEPNEAARLAGKYAARDDITVEAKALGAVPDSSLTLWITAHRGYVGTTKPNPDSLWFGEVRKDEGTVEGSIDVPSTTLDAVFADRGRRIDFLKIDVEGEELAVMRGGAKALDRVLAMRIEVQFDDSFSSQTASDIFRHAIDERDFRLMRTRLRRQGSAPELSRRRWELWGALRLRRCLRAETRNSRRLGRRGSGRGAHQARRFRFAQQHGRLFSGLPEQADGNRRLE